MNKKQHGFGVVEAFIILILIGIVGFAVFTVARREKTSTNTNSTSESSEVANEKDVTTTKEGTQLKTYKDKLTGYSLDYPTNWTVATKEQTTYGEDKPTSLVTITSDTGLELELKHNFGGKGGDCIPKEGDKPHAIGNDCATEELLSLVKTGKTVRAIDSSVNVSSSARFKDADLYVQHIKYTYGGDRASEYLLGIGAYLPNALPKLNDPQMGAYFQLSILNIYPNDDVYKSYNLDVRMNKSGSSEAFFAQKDVKEAEEILKSITFQK